MLRVGFLGALSSSFADRVRAHLTVPCDFVHTDEASALTVLAEVDVLVTLVFTQEMAVAATRLRLVQVPGAGLDRIDRSAVPAGVSLANVHGHETGIAEYVLGAMIALSRNFDRLNTSLRAGRWDSQWAPGVPPPPVWPELSGRTLGILVTARGQPNSSRIGGSSSEKAVRAFTPSPMVTKATATITQP
jgi:phosphoglycerate dehydrogenase-like enzyme